MCHDIGGTVPPAAALKGFGETGTHKALTLARAGSTPAIPVLRKYQSGDWDRSYKPVAVSSILTFRM